jgi:hypothetical protein
MSLALVRKELREHGLVLLVSALFSFVALLGFVVIGEESGGRFAALKSFALSLGVLNALVTANRLFVREYAGRTQLFLEVLPIRRSHVFATKWLLGALWVALLMAVAWASVLRHQQKTEVIALGDALHVLSATLMFATAAWSFAVMAGMLGRHRYTVWIALLITVAVAVDAGNLSPEEIPVVNLLSDRVAMARGAAPWASFAWAGALTVLFVAGAAALALVGSGAIASTLARRMTARERVFLLVSVLVAGFVYSAVTGKRQKPAFDVADAEYVRGKHARIGMMATADMASEQLLELCRLIADDVDAAIEALGIVHTTPAGARSEPAIFVMPQQGLDRTVIERAALSEHEGIVLRAAPNVPRSALRAQVVHELVNDASLHRALHEDRHVLLDGFALALATRADPEARELAWLRFASHASPIDARRLTRWEETMEQLGFCTADALAFATVEVAGEALGQAKLRTLLRSLFRRPHDDVRVLLEEPPAAQLARAGLPWPELARRIEARRVELRARFAAQLSGIPARKAWIEASRSPTRGASVRAHVEGAVAYRVMYAALGPWTSLPQPVARLDVRGAHDAIEQKRRVTGTVPIALPKGSRLFVAIDIEEPVLQCPLRLTSKRVVMP